MCYARIDLKLQPRRKKPVYAVDAGVYNVASAVNWVGSLGLFQQFTEIERFDEYLRKIDTPLLIMGAENNRVVALDAQKNLALKLPNCKYCVIHGARHEVLMESDEFRSIFWRQFDSFTREEMHTNRKTDRI